MSFGRDLGMVKTQTKWGNCISENKEKPGFVDMKKLKSSIKIYDGSDFFKTRWESLDIAMHDSHNAYPDFMEQYSAPKKEEEKFPSNTDAASELAVGILKYGYNNFTRPSTFEIVNEPHWSVLKEKTFADLHLAVLKKARKEKVKTLIGGPCYAVSYFYKNNYTSLNAFSAFIDNTNAELDFYSLHIYDFLKWNAEKKDFLGRVTTGLPIEGVLDALQNFTVNKYEKEIPMVISEHGGYLFKNKEFIIEQELSEKLIGQKKKNFTYETKRRSVSDRIMTRSAISNTMSFMNNPHVIQKAVPFILLQTVSWNPKYYATLLFPKKYQKGNEWVESANINFYKLFAEIKGKRVLSYCEDPDIQYQTFLDKKDLYVVLNNLGGKSEKIDFKFTNSDIKEITAKRHGQNADFTPYFKEEKINDITKFTLKAKESVVLKVTYKQKINTTKSIDVVPYYSKLGQQVIKSGEKVDFPISIPKYNKAANATLRISVGRKGSNMGKNLDVLFNGTSLKVPVEDVADYLQDDTDYGSIKIINIDPKLLKEDNTVKLSFPDGKIGGIGSVVLRVGFLKN